MRWHGHNKEADLADGFRIVGSDRPGLERVYVQLDTALEVGGLVLVDHVILGNLSSMAVTFGSSTSAASFSEVLRNAFIALRAVLW